MMDKINRFKIRRVSRMIAAASVALTISTPFAAAYVAMATTVAATG
jgi:hypothetical protein